jgi:hypothetical protein
MEDQEIDNNITFKFRGRISLHGYYMLRNYMAEKHFERLADKSHTTGNLVLR